MTNDEPPPEAPMVEVLDAPEGQKPQMVGIPDLIRVMGDGSIAVDDERWLGVSIPSGTPFYSESVVLGLREALADAQERGRALERSVELLSDNAEAWSDEPTGYSNHEFLAAVSELPKAKIKSMAAIALTMLGKHDVEAVFRLAGVKSVLKLVPANG